MITAIAFVWTAIAFTIFGWCIGRGSNANDINRLDKENRELIEQVNDLNEQFGYGLAR